MILVYAACGSPSAAPPVDEPIPAPTPPPTWSSDFASTGGLWGVSIRSGGSVLFGASESEAADNAVAHLVLPGNARLSSGQHVGPGFATEIGSLRTFLYGTFRMRVRLATCRPNEEAVNGIFTYFNDGSDADGNGIADNSEIDIEVLCSNPSIVSLTSWTDYEEEPQRFRKWTRAVDLETGEVLESFSDREFGVVSKGIDPALRHPGFPEPGAFYEMGFDWHADRLRYFLVLDGAELTLWDFRDRAHIPQRPSTLQFNVWHPRDHWFGPAGGADYPAGDARMDLDWARYWEG